MSVYIMSDCVRWIFGIQIYVLKIFTE